MKVGGSQGAKNLGIPGTRFKQIHENRNRVSVIPSLIKRQGLAESRLIPEALGARDHFQELERAFVSWIYTQNRPTQGRRLLWPARLIVGKRCFQLNNGIWHVVFS